MTTKTLFTLPSSETITNDILVSENAEQTLSNKKFKDSDENEYTIENLAKLNTDNTFTGRQIINNSVEIHGVYTYHTYSDLISGNSLYKYMGKEASIGKAFRVEYKHNNILANIYAEIGIYGYHALNIYYNKIIAALPIEATTILLNGTDLQTSLNNCAKLDTSNTFTSKQTINGNLTVNNNMVMNIDYDSRDVEAIKILRPNMPTENGRTYILLGQSYTTGNVAHIFFNYTGDNDDNYLGIQFNDYWNLYNFYRDRALFTVPLSVVNQITVDNPTTSQFQELLRLYSENLPVDGYTRIMLGRNTDKGNAAMLQFHYVGNDDKQNYFSICINGHWNLYKFYREGAYFDLTITVFANVTATAFVQSSDRRLKENIQELNIDDENLIDKIKVYSFNLINDTEQPKRKRYGVIAQELQEVMPELVYDDNSENHYLSVDYISLIPHLINKVKTQQKLINEQNEKINDLTNKMNKVFEVLDLNRET